MRLFGIRLFKSRRDLDVEEANVAVLRGLVEAQRGNATPQEALAAMMKQGNHELRPNARPDQAPNPEASQAAVSPPSANTEALREVAPMEPDEPAAGPITHLDNARLVELLGPDDSESKKTA